jgi:hypothetical protein
MAEPLVDLRAGRAADRRLRGGLVKRGPECTLLVY